MFFRKKFSTGSSYLGFKNIIYFIIILHLISVNLIGEVSNVENSILNEVKGRNNIISVCGNSISLKNSLGCRLDIYHKDGQYGLGSFYLNDTQLGGLDTVFAHSDNHYVWDPYKATRYEIIENTPQRGIIKFYGKIGVVPTGATNTDFEVTITLSNKNTAYNINFTVLPKRIITPDHPLYIAIPFFHSKMDFVSYPFKQPVRSPFQGRWVILPNLGTVPFMFGCERLKGKNYFVGVGYYLKGQDYTKGRFEYDTMNPELPMKIYFPYHSWYYGHGPYTIHFVVSVAETQADCIRSYMEESGFDISSPVRRKIKDSISALMRAYKNAPINSVYVPGKGYRGHAWSNSDEEVTRFAYPFVWVGVGAQLAYLFYKYWENHPEENWAKERAIEMADFFVSSQIDNGAVPLVWKVRENKYGTTHKTWMEPHGYIYSPWMVSIGAHSLYRLYLERKNFEGVANKKWKESALKAINWIVERVETDGLLGHTYNKEGKYTHIGSQAPWSLIALDYFYQVTKDKRYDRAREILEKWTYETFARINEWYSGTDDDCSFKPGGPQFKNHDGVDVFTFAAYCAKRYMETKKPRYLHWAKDVAWYGWLTRMPINMPGFIYPTKGMAPEQYFWQEYSVPWYICTNRCFPYLSILTEEPFYAKYYKVLIQTMMAYQCYDDKYPFFVTHLRHNPKGDGPIDQILHQQKGKKAPWTIIFTSFFLEDMTAPYTYSYFGSKDWGIGLDYHFDFKPDFGDNPYVLASKTRLVLAEWNSQEQSLYAKMKGEVGEKGELLIKWYPDKYPLSHTNIFINNDLVENTLEYFLSDKQIFNVNFTHKTPIVTVIIRAK